MLKKYRGLWSILAVAFIAFFAYSFYGPFNFGGIELKASELADDVKPTPAQPTKPTVVASKCTTKVQKQKETVMVDTCAKTILFIGDSMLDGLSPRLAAYAAANRHTLYSVVWYSSTSEIWGRSSRITEYVKRLHPDYMFICLGANELFVSNIKTKRQKFVDSMLAQIGDIPFVWIGPPNWREDTGINELIEASVPKGCYFKSNGMEFKRKKDGAHPTMESAALWMDSVARWMPAHAAHPIMMTMPEDGAKARPKRIFLHQPSER